MKVYEEAKIHIHQYPFAEKLNPILHKIILEKSVNEDMGALMTDWETFIPEFETIGKYAIDLIRGWKWSLDTPVRQDDPLRLDNLWGQWYRKGDYQIEHTHYPNQWSFVYFVNTPRGSSPLVFTTSRKKIKAEEGKVVIFPGYLYHQVPKNQCDGRIVLAGNLLNNRGK